MPWGASSFVQRLPLAGACFLTAIAIFHVSLALDFSARNDAFTAMTHAFPFAASGLVVVCCNSSQRHIRAGWRALAVGLFVVAVVHAYGKYSTTHISPGQGVDFAFAFSQMLLGIMAASAMIFTYIGFFFRWGSVAD